MARCPFAKWRPLPENATQAPLRPTQVILHSAVDAPGPTSLFPFFARADIRLESHFFVRMDGGIEQYMDTAVRADANRDANESAISIETEDDGTPDERPWNGAQLAALRRLLAWAHATHGIPLGRCISPVGAGIGWHSMWGAPSPWTPSAGKTCPGKARIAQIPGLIASLSPAPAPTEDDMTPEQANQLHATCARCTNIEKWIGGDNGILHQLADLAAKIAAIEAKLKAS